MMIEINGSKKSGSGTILRYSLALASLTGRKLCITNIRAKRPKPGLRPQHLQVVKACEVLTSGHTEGAKIGSREIVFEPKKFFEGGKFKFEIGTAGSTTMLALSLLPLALFAKKPSFFTLKGGLFQDFAPSAHHMQHILLPLLKRMGIDAELEIVRPGYVPKGDGIINLKVSPQKEPIRALRLLKQGKITCIKGVALSSHLEERKVSQRMAKSFIQTIKRFNFLDPKINPQIEIVEEKSASQEGASLSAWAITDTGCVLGRDRAGKLGRRAEDIGRFVAKALAYDIDKGATVDIHTADQLILFAALSPQTTEYIIPELTEHIETNLWLVKIFLNAETSVEGQKVRIKGKDITNLKKF